MAAVRQQISTPDAPPPAGAYSQGIASAGFLFLAGQGPFDTSGQRVPATFAEEARRAFGNLRTIASAAGADLRNAVRIGVYLLDMDNFQEMNDVCREFFDDPLPARTTIQADLRGFQIEVDAIVALDS
jgi:2-iminobutanoate/2-iminopropanoate deaminase